MKIKLTFPPDRKHKISLADYSKVQKPISEANAIIEELCGGELHTAETDEHRDILVSLALEGIREAIEQAIIISKQEAK